MARTSLLVLCLALLICCNVSVAQQNAATSVAPSLIECYNTTALFETDRRLPASINVLIELIRKAEDGRAVQDARQLSIELIHRFRQDGILRSINPIGNSQFALPFSPRGFQAWKNRVLLTDMIPGSAVNFPNETLNALERCSLHFMMSNTVDVNVRGDEANVCTRLGRYERRTRSVDDEVEVFKKDELFQQLKGNIEEANENAEEPAPEVPEENEDIAPEPGNEEDGTMAENIPNQNERTGSQVVRSDCPVEGGVIYTRWGAIQAGTVIAGIASGLEPQSSQEEGIAFNSRFVATLSGDLAEVALYQTSISGQVRTVGVTGGWNSTQVPRWYFINSNTHFEMTDADIRAGIDGLVLAENVRNWVTSFQTLKVSQILDMYYSPRGVFAETVRACNRNNLLTTVAPTETLLRETTGFSYRFDRKATFPETILRDGIPTLAQNSVDLFNTYVPTLTDLQCISDTTSRNRIDTEIIIVLDARWPHTTAHPAISYLLDNLDVNRFESTYTIINGVDGRVVVNSSYSILDYHQQFNLTVQQAHPGGFEYRRVYLEVENIVRARMDNFTDAGAKSTIALFMPFQSTVSEEDRSFARERLEIYRSLLPDLRIMVLGGGSRDAYIELTTGGNVDVFILPNSNEGSNIVGAVNPVLDRIREVPRRIINPACGSQFLGTEGNTHTFDDFLEPQTINYYRISPNYFFGEGDRALVIRGQGYGSFVVCTSRTDMLVNQNSTAVDRDCRNMNSNEERFLLTGLCTDGFIVDCNPLYISLQSTSPNTVLQCTDIGCRFPDNIRVTFTLENFSCRSSSFKIAGSLSLLALMLAVLKL